MLPKAWGTRSMPEMPHASEAAERGGGEGIERLSAGATWGAAKEGGAGGGAGAHRRARSAAPSPSPRRVSARGREQEPSPPAKNAAGQQSPVSCLRPPVAPRRNCGACSTRTPPRGSEGGRSAAVSGPHRAVEVLWENFERLVARQGRSSKPHHLQIRRCVRMNPHRRMAAFTVITRKY